MKRIKKASALLICLLILYGATVGALFKMSKNEMLTLYELARVETANLYHSRISDAQEKVEKGEITVDGALCYITESKAIFVDTVVLAAAGPADEEEITAAQGEIREDFAGKTPGEIFTEYYEADDSVAVKKSDPDVDDIFFDFFIFSLGDEEYRFIFHIIVNLNYVSLVNDSFISEAITISVLYVAVALFVIFRKPKGQGTTPTATDSAH